MLIEMLTSERGSLGKHDTAGGESHPLPRCLPLLNRVRTRVVWGNHNASNGIVGDGRWAPISLRDPLRDPPVYRFVCHVPWATGPPHQDKVNAPKV